MIIPKYTKEEFKKASCAAILPLECNYCKKTYYTSKINIRNYLNPKRKGNKEYCSRLCRSIAEGYKKVLNCLNCNKEFIKSLSQFKLTPKSFCCKSCASKYNNAHKVKGNNRSKLEFWLENKLKILYPNLEIQYNNSTLLKLELDIYIPSLRLAFEINGIFHYEAIFGQEKLEKTQNRDNMKYQLCIENKISLCVIDSSSLKYFKEEKGKQYLDIITNIIDLNLKNQENN